MGFSQSGPSSGAPLNAEYLTYSTNATLSAERAVTAPDSTLLSVPIVIKQSVDLTNSVLASPLDTDLTFNMTSGKRYYIYIMQVGERTAGATASIRYSYTTPALEDSVHQKRMNATDASPGVWSGNNDISTGNPRYTRTAGIIEASANGAFTVRFTTSVDTETITFYKESFMIIWELP